MRRPALAAGAVVVAAAVLSGCSGEPTVDESSVTESLNTLAEASGVDFHQVRINDGEQNKAVHAVVSRGGATETWSLDVGSDEVGSRESPVLPGGRAFGPDEVPAERVVELLQRDDCADWSSIEFAITPTDLPLFTSSCDLGPNDHPIRSWLGDAEVPQVPAELSAQTWDVLLDEIAAILPDGAATGITVTLADGQNEIQVIGAVGPMGHAENCAVTYFRDLGPSSSELTLSQCRPAAGEVFSAHSMTGARLMAAAEEIAAQLQVPVSDLWMIRIDDTGDGVWMQGFGPDGAATVAVS